jgi:hypothetical protein
MNEILYLKKKEIIFQNLHNYIIGDLNEILKLRRKKNEGCTGSTSGSM